MRFLNRHISLLSMLLAIFFFTASASVFYAFAEQKVSVECCDKDETPRTPVEDGECFDCQCLSCSLALSSTLDTKAYHPPFDGMGNSSVDGIHPSDYIQRIEYPPEVS